MRVRMMLVVEFNTPRKDNSAGRRQRAANSEKMGAPSMTVDSK